MTCRPQSGTIQLFNTAFAVSVNVRTILMTAFHRKFAQGLLVRKIKCRSGYIFHPKKVYTYNSIIENVKLLMSRPNFVRQCGIWKELVYCEYS